MSVFSLENNLINESLKEEIHEWVFEAPGEFNYTDAVKELDLLEKHGRQQVVAAFESLVFDGILQRVGKRRGWYRPSLGDLRRMDFINADDSGVDLWMPFNLDRMVKIMPGNIIQINGEKNSGKTAFVLNLIRYNFKKWSIHYFNSEMGPGELRMRLGLFEGLPLGDWKFDAYERSESFSEVIFPGSGNLNVIDFLEVHDNFFLMGEYMRQIHDALKGAIAIVAVHKNVGQEFGLGGARTEEKPRLILNISSGKLKIKMAKNWCSKTNPNGSEIRFKLFQGCKFRPICDWEREV